MTTTYGKPWEAAPFPEAVYGCADSGCAEEMSYPPEMIYWVDAYIEGSTGDSGWYCENCLDNNGYPTRGPSLLDELKRRRTE